MSGATDFWIRWRVRVGYPAGAAAFFFARPQTLWIAAGTGVAVLGLALRGWAAGHLRKHEALASSGPYAYTRNPLYLGSVILGAGFAVASRSWISAALLAAYFAAFYPMVIRREARELAAHYGATFQEYAARVPAFWPRFGARGSSAGPQFSWGLYLRNREYEAALGSAVGIVLLWLLMLWRR